MPSPFPGVDPFLEGPDWEDFHHTFITELKAALVPQMRPKYVVRTDMRVYQQMSLEEEEIKEAFITLRRRDDDRLVTVIEILSPSNKRAGSTGRAEYLQKRDRHLAGKTHLVEIDLLRGGERLPMASPLPVADYFAFVSRGERRPQCDLYRWSLRQKLPKIHVPLADDDPDIILDLQQAFHQAYDTSGYDYSLDYSRALSGLREADRAWVAACLQNRPKPQ